MACFDWKPVLVAQRIFKRERESERERERCRDKSKILGQLNKIVTSVLSMLPTWWSPRRRGRGPHNPPGRGSWYVAPGLVPRSLVPRERRKGQTLGRPTGPPMWKSSKRSKTWSIGWKKNGCILPSGKLT